MAIKKTLNIFAIVVAMMFNQIVIPMNVKAYDDVDETEIVCYYSEYEDDSEDDEVDEEYEEEHYEETDEDYEEAYSEAEVWEDWDIFFGYTEFDDKDEEIDEDEDSDYDDDEDYDDEDYSDDEEDEEDDEYWDDDDEDEWVDDCDDDWYDDEDYPDDDDDYVYEYDCTPTYVEDRLAASCLNDSEQAQNVADIYGFVLLSYDNGVALFDTNGQDPLSYVNGNIELPDGLYFQLVVEIEFEPVDDDDFELPTDDDCEDDGYTDGIEIGVDISEIDAIMDLVDGDESSEEIIEENFEIGIDE